MTEPGTAREALIAEAIGDVATLLDRAEAVATAMQEASHAFQQARLDLEEQVSGFERRMVAATQVAKVEVARHIAARTDDAARQSIDQQSRAVTDAARVALGAELVATMQGLRAALQPRERRQRRWDTWLTHGAAATAASAATLLLVAFFRAP